VNKSEFSSIIKVVSGIIKLVEDPDSTANDFTKILEIAPPFTAKLLKFSNSVFYSPRKEITDITRAIIFIGFSALKELALSQKVCEMFQKDDLIEGYTRPELWKNSVGVALTGKMICRREFGETGENAYIAGLLHNIGLIAEDQFLQDEFKKCLIKANSEKINLTKAESEIIGYDHTEIGEAIAIDWNFPEELSTSIKHHHDPTGLTETFSKDASILYLADFYCRDHGIGYSDTSDGGNDILDICLNKLGISFQGMELIMEDVKNEIREMEDQGLI
ncbi:MAG: HDOD domain-containing protein, partial [Deltaproteobacteria bacterium]|nr:HDOD domain-containing protein [Deltaproteobacteria bacterium]